METRYPTLYRRFKSMGFSSAKAVEILLDAACGDSYALNWVGIIFRCRRS